MLAADLSKQQVPKHAKLIFVLAKWIFNIVQRVYIIPLITPKILSMFYDLSYMSYGKHINFQNDFANILGLFWTWSKREYQNSYLWCI